MNYKSYFKSEAYRDIYWGDLERHVHKDRYYRENKILGLFQLYTFIEEFVEQYLKSLVGYTYKKEDGDSADIVSWQNEVISFKYKVCDSQYGMYIESNAEAVKKDFAFVKRIYEDIKSKNLDGLNGVDTGVPDYSNALYTLTFTGRDLQTISGALYVSSNEGQDWEDCEKLQKRIDKILRNPPKKPKE